MLGRLVCRKNLYSVFKKGYEIKIIKRLLRKTNIKMNLKILWKISLKI